MDMRDDSAAGDGRLDERVQLLVASDGELQVAGGDTLHLEILGGVAGQLENLKSKHETCRDGSWTRNISILDEETAVLRDEQTSAVRYSRMAAL